MAVADAYVVAAGQPFSVSAATGVLTNNVNVDLAPMTATLVVDVTSGSLDLNDDGSFTYQPAATGVQTFSYRVFDATGFSNTVVVTLTVDAPPAADNDGYGTTEDAPLVVPAGQGVLIGDTDAEMQTLTAHVATPPAFGQLLLAADGSLTYTPNPNFSGDDSFTYQANDGDQLSGVATVSLNVAARNDAPIAVADAYFGFQNGNAS